MDWILNSMKESIAANFNYTETTKELQTQVRQPMTRKQIVFKYLNRKRKLQHLDKEIYP